MAEWRTNPGYPRFAPIKQLKELQQFLGCSNWVRWYMTDRYPRLVKLLAKYLKPDTVYPKAGLGAGDTQDDKIVLAI